MTPWSSFAVERELVNRQALALDRDAGLVNRDAVLAGFKLGIVRQGAYAQAAAGLADRAATD